MDSKENSTPDRSFLMSSKKNQQKASQRSGRVLTETAQTVKEKKKKKGKSQRRENSSGTHSTFEPEEKKGKKIKLKKKAKRKRLKANGKTVKKKKTKSKTKDAGKLKKKNKKKLKLGKRSCEEMLSESGDQKGPGPAKNFKQVKITESFELVDSRAKSEIPGDSVESLFARLVEFQGQIKSKSCGRELETRLKNLIESLKPSIVSIAKILKKTVFKKIKNDRKEDLGNLTNLLQNCLFLRCRTPLKSNSLWSDVYAPRSYSHLLSNNRISQIEEHLLELLLNSEQQEKLNQNSHFVNPRKKNRTIFDRVKQQSESTLRFLSQRSQKTGFFGLEFASEVHKNMLLFLGPKSCGKFSNLKVFASKCNFELEVFDFALQDKLISIKRKFMLASATNDVRVNLMDQLQKQRPKAKAEESPSLKVFFKRMSAKNESKKIVVDESSNADSRIQTMLKGNKKRKIFVCRNLDHLYDRNRFQNKKKFVKNFSEFINFVKKSQYPFVFISSNEIKCSKLFGHHTDLLKIFQFDSPDPQEVTKLLTVILFIEKMFHEFSLKKLSNKNSILSEDLEIRQNLPCIKIIQKFILKEGVNLSCVLAKSIFFYNFFFKKTLDDFQMKTYKDNFKVHNMCNLIRSFPKKPLDLEASFLEENFQKMLQDTKNFKKQEMDDYRKKIYKDFLSKQWKAKKKSKKLESLLKYKNCLKIQALTDNCQKMLDSPYEHVNLQCETDFPRILDPQEKFSKIFDRLTKQKVAKQKSKKQKREIQKLKDYLQQNENFHDKIKVYNQTFNKQIPSAFFQNNQLRFGTSAIDLSKQVEISRLIANFVVEQNQIH